MNARQLDELIKIVDDPHQEVLALYKTERGYEMFLEKYENGSLKYYEAVLPEAGNIKLTTTTTDTPL